MCQLLGMSRNQRAAITFSFTGFSQRGGKTDSHVDGWGIAFYEGGGCRVFHDDQPASDSALARFVRDYPIKSRIVISHLRKATQGAVNLANCHPFQREWQGQTWLFANNGDLQNFSPALCGDYLPVGTTDSEVAFCYLMQTLRKRFAGRGSRVPWQELAPEIARITAEIATHGNFNYLLTNGEATFAHCSSKLYLLKRQHPFAMATLKDCDLSMNLGALNAEGDRMALIATEPLTCEAAWTAFQTGETQVLVDGESVWRHVEPTTRRFAPPASYNGREWADQTLTPV